jgi:aryl-alcohol dehydrogenase-like predicted oxidoreductase
MSTLATPDATAEFASLHPDLPGNFRLLDQLHISSLGLGTYLGRDQPGDDDLYRDAALRCFAAGINLIDTAINYRAQRSERALGQALARLTSPSLGGGLRRDQIVVCTKAGFLPFDGTVPQDGAAYLRRTYVDSGLVPPDAIVAGCHCLHPAYLRDQLARSLRNLRLQAVDVFYLHNPETQLDEVDPPTFEGRLRDAFATLEDLCDQGLIGRYGCATWAGLRVPPEDPGHLSLTRLVEIARSVAGDRHRLRVVQLPLNLNLTEALLTPTQEIDGHRLPALQAAAELGLFAVCSGPLLQGKLLSRPFPERLRTPFPQRLRRDSQRALHFVRSAPGVTAVLCGMKSPAHLSENLEILQFHPMSPDSFARSFLDRA